MIKLDLYALEIKYNTKKRKKYLEKYKAENYHKIYDDDDDDDGYDEIINKKIKTKIEKLESGKREMWCIH
jgi:hypothetical protein